MSVVEAASLDKAVSFAHRTEGTSNVRKVEPSTRDDVEWFQSFGGHIQEVA